MSGVADALFMEKDAGVLVTFNPPTAGQYLVGFTVGSGSVTYTLSGTNATHATAMNSNGHLLFVTDVTTPNHDIHFKLEGQSLWAFLSCEITQIK